MKKVICVLITAVMLASISACGSKSASSNLSRSSRAAEIGSVSGKPIDVDLTQLSSTMVYSEVFNMMMSPDDYVGKIVKMQGTYTVYDGEIRKYHACLIADATACCAQGIEFQLTQEYQYPDDYPKEGELITVIGIFDVYKEGSYQYYQLSNAEIAA